MPHVTAGGIVGWQSRNTILCPRARGRSGNTPIKCRPLVGIIVLEDNRIFIESTPVDQGESCAGFVNQSIMREGTKPIGRGFSRWVQVPADDYCSATEDSNRGQIFSKFLRGHIKSGSSALLVKDEGNKDEVVSAELVGWCGSTTTVG